MGPEPAIVERFRRDLDALAVPDHRLGIALSGGPDSVALLLLAAAARPGLIEAATVDHALRDESKSEAEIAGGLCRELGVPHTILTAAWTDKPTTAIQERARAERYRLLSAWAEECGIQAIVTGHHADDQAETLLMRLNRGSGVRGLAAMRPIATLPGSDLPLLRPLLTWRRTELEQVCASSGVEPAADPSNGDERYERVRIRKALSEAPWLDPGALAASAGHLASADDAIEWAVDREWHAAVTHAAGKITYAPAGSPPEILRRIVVRAIASLANKGPDDAFRAREVDLLLAALANGKQATLRGVLCAGGPTWLFSQAPERRH